MNNQRFKSIGKKSLFDEQFSTEKLKEIGNPLAMVSKVIDFEMFIDLLESKLLNSNKKNNAGAKPYDVVLMFKIWYNGHLLGYFLDTICKKIIPLT